MAEQNGGEETVSKKKKKKKKKKAAVVVNSTGEDTPSSARGDASETNQNGGSNSGVSYRSICSYFTHWLSATCD